MATKTKLNIEQIKIDYQMALCRRAYENLANYHDPAIAEQLEAMVGARVPLDTIRLWTNEIVSADESKVRQQIMSAARWLEFVRDND